MTSRQTGASPAKVTDELAKVYVVGDSHVSSFVRESGIIDAYPNIERSDYPNVFACRLGGVLAGTMHRDDTTMQGRPKAFALLQDIEPGSRLLLLLGEIDCRVHIIRRADFDAARYSESVRSTVENYQSFLKDYKKACDEKGILLGVISPPPTRNFSGSRLALAIAAYLARGAPGSARRILTKLAVKILPRKSKLRKLLATGYIYAGDTETRNRIAAMFTEALSELCDREGLMFIDMNTPFVSSDGRTDVQWFWDEVHLSGRAIARLAPAFEQQGILNFSGHVAEGYAEG